MSYRKLKRLIVSGSIKYAAEIEREAFLLGLNVRRKGPELVLDSPIELLDSAKISNQINHAPLDLEVLWTVDSTNSYLMRRLVAPPKGYVVCLAEHQEKGRGRRGRQWVSPFGRNLYISIARVFSQVERGLDGLSLAVGIQLAKTLKQKKVDNLGLKWPNDLLLNNAKLAGILVEIGPMLGPNVCVIVGIGVNLELTKEDSLKIGQPHSDLCGVLECSRNLLAGEVIQNVISGINIFSQYGFSAFAKEWDEYNLYHDKQVLIHIAGSVVAGIDAGVDELGNLLLSTETGIKSFNSGEISLRGKI